MADNIATLNSLNTGSFLIPELWSKDIIEANMPNLLFMPFSSKSLEANASTIRWAVAGTLNNGGTLAEGTQISAGTLSIAQITASPVEYGNAITWSGVQDLISFTDMRNSVAYKAVREDYGQTMDKLCYNALIAGTFTVGGGTFGTANVAAFSGTLGNADYSMNSNVIAIAVEQLKLRKAKPFENGRYTIVLGVSQVTKLYSDGTFREIQRYMTNDAPLINGVMPSGWRCAYSGADIYETTEVTNASLIFGTCGTVSATRGLAFGKDAFGDGWNKPLEITYYDDANLDAKRLKKLTWYSHGLVKVLKPENVVVIRTTSV